MPYLLPLAAIVLPTARINCTALFPHLACTKDPTFLYLTCSGKQTAFTVPFVHLLQLVYFISFIPSRLLWHVCTRHFYGRGWGQDLEWGRQGEGCFFLSPVPASPAALPTHCSFPTPFSHLPCLLTSPHLPHLPPGDGRGNLRGHSGSPQEAVSGGRKSPSFKHSLIFISF